MSSGIHLGGSVHSVRRLWCNEALGNANEHRQVDEFVEGDRAKYDSQSQPKLKVGLNAGIELVQ
eukprot:4196345-Prymnesium_polylepis.1